MLHVSLNVTILLLLLYVVIISGAVWPRMSRPWPQ